MRSFYDRIVAFIFAIALLLAGNLLANAGPFEDALAGFTTDSFGDIADAIDALAASGDPRTGPLLEALKDQRLLYSAEAKKVFIRDPSGKVTDAASGEQWSRRPQIPKMSASTTACVAWWMPRLDRSR